MTRQHPSAEALLSHADFVRRLARRLVSDEATADDVVQETLLAALKRPPADHSRLRQWLGAVACRLALRFRRSDTRRARRERHAAKRDGVASTVDVASALEIQRCVVEEVIALEEPYRSTIVRRYFHGMTTKALAGEMSVSVKTVQSRIARARDQLRARLDRRHGGNRRTWVVGLIPLLEGRSAAAANALATIGSLKLAAVALVLLGVGMTLLLWHDLEDQTAPMTGGRALSTAVRELPEAPSDEPEVTPSAVPEVWRRLLGELYALRTEDYAGGQELAPRIATVLRDDLQLRLLAIKELQRLDAGDAWFHAAVLAAAIGQVPDAAAARQLFGILPKLSNHKVLQHTVRALGQNRHGVKVPPGTWSISAGMVTVNGPIVEDDIRSGLLTLARKLGGSDDPVGRRFLGTLLQVLSQSQDEDEHVAAFFVDLASSASEPGRSRALSALCRARNSRAAAFLRRAFPEANDPQELGEIASGLIRADPRNVFLVLDRLEHGNLSVRAKVRLINSLVGLHTRDPVILGRVGRLFMELIHKHDSPRLQSMALLSVNVMIVNRHRADEFRQAVTELTRNQEASLSSRARAIRMLSSWGRQVGVTRPFLWRLALDSQVDAGLRAHALASWGQTATDEVAESMLEEVGRLKASPEGKRLTAAIEEAERRLRQRIQRDRR